MIMVGHDDITMKGDFAAVAPGGIKINQKFREGSIPKQRSSLIDAAGKKIGVMGEVYSG